MSRLEITEDTTIEEVTGCGGCASKKNCGNNRTPETIARGSVSDSTNKEFAAAQNQARRDAFSWEFTKEIGGERLCWLNDDKDNAFLINPLQGSDYELTDAQSGKWVGVFTMLADCLAAAKQILVDRRSLSKITRGLAAKKIHDSQENPQRTADWVTEQTARNRGLEPHSKATTTNPKDLQGIKKPPVELVPDTATIITAMAFKDGAAKYGAYNWREKPVKASIYVAAAKRHLAAWYNGEENAEDSGVHHLGHALACLSILVDAQVGGNLVDDRPMPIDIGALIELLKVED